MIHRKGFQHLQTRAGSIVICMDASLTRQRGMKKVYYVSKAGVVSPMLRELAPRRQEPVFTQQRAYLASHRQGEVRCAYKYL